MKQTSEDRRFAINFASELQPHITREQNKGRALAKIAKELGVTAPGLQKQLSGGTPSIRTVALAHKIYRVSVPYRGIDFAKTFRGKDLNQKQTEQLFLPFEITTPSRSGGIDLKLSPYGTRRYRLQLTLRAAR